MRVKILDAAERDLEVGYRFYERQSAGLGFCFLDSLYSLYSLYSDIDSLSYFEGIQHRVFGYYRLLSKRFPFAVYYKALRAKSWLWLYSIVAGIRVG